MEVSFEPFSKHARVAAKRSCRQNVNGETAMNA
jgi:hypothetical protein